MACKPNVSKPSSLTSAPRRRVVPARNSTRGRVACHLLSSSAGTVRLGMRRAATAAFVVRAAAVEVQRPPPPVVDLCCVLCFCRLRPRIQYALQQLLLLCCREPPLQRKELGPCLVKFVQVGRVLHKLMAERERYHH